MQTGRTGAVRCDLVVRGSDVAPPGPELGRRVPVVPFMPHAKPMPQVMASYNWPLLSVRDRLMPLLRARRGHGRRGPTALQRGGVGYKLNQRVRPVHDDHLPRWQAPHGARQSICLDQAVVGGVQDSAD
jgi:hypothetical protein